MREQTPPGPDATDLAQPARAPSLPDLRQLRVFAAVAEHESFTRAARALFMAQSSVSAQVQLLERQIGAPLFTRDSRHVGLTAAGSALLPQARCLLDDARRLVDAARSSSGQRVRLDVGHDGNPAGTALVRELLRRGHPHGAVVLRASGGVRAMLPALRAGGVEIGLGRPALLPEGFDHEPLTSEPVVAVHRGDHFTTTSRVRVEDLGGRPLLALDLEGRAPEWVDFAVRSCGAVPWPVAASGVVSALALAPREVILVPAGLAPALRAAGCTTAQVTGVPDYPVAVIWLTERHADAAVVAARTAARAVRTVLHGAHPWQS